MFLPLRSLAEHRAVDRLHRLDRPRGPRVDARAAHRDQPEPPPADPPFDLDDRRHPIERTGSCLIRHLARRSNRSANTDALGQDDYSPANKRSSAVFNSARDFGPWPVVASCAAMQRIANVSSGVCCWSINNVSAFPRLKVRYASKYSL